MTATFHKEKLEFVGNAESEKTGAFQEFQLHIIAAVAQFERPLILDRQREGIAIANKTGKYRNVGGNPSCLMSRQANSGSILEKGERAAVLARKYDVNRQTVYANIIKIR